MYNNINLKLPGEKSKTLPFSYNDGVPQDKCLINNFAQKISGKDDILYATNLEMCHIIEYFKHLEHSADIGMIYNPSERDDWKETPTGQIVAIKSGETLKI